jgi:hypothetical protein
MSRNYKFPVHSRLPTRAGNISLSIIINILHHSVR